MSGRTRDAFLFVRVHIRMLFVLDIPWDPVTLDLYVHDEKKLLIVFLKSTTLK